VAVRNATAWAARVVDNMEMVFLSSHPSILNGLPKLNCSNTKKVLLNKICKVKRDYYITNALGAKSVLKSVILLAHSPLKENDLLLYFPRTETVHQVFDVYTHRERCCANLQ
jgi:hypothetical protein